MYGFVLISVVAARTLDGFYGENAAARGYIDEGDIGFYLGMVTEVLNIEIGIEFDHHGHDDDKCAYQAVELSFGKKGFAELEFFRHDEIALFGAFDRLYETVYVGRRKTLGNAKDGESAQVGEHLLDLSVDRAKGLVGYVPSIVAKGKDRDVLLLADLRLRRQAGK